MKYLEWVEPTKGVDSEGNRVDVTLTIRVTEAAAIKIQRAKMKKHQSIVDEDLLLDFIAVNWAKVTEYEK